MALTVNKSSNSCMVKRVSKLLELKPENDKVKLF